MIADSIIVLGSLHYDIYIESPLIPKVGETVLGTTWYPKLGGKGANQTVALCKEGINVKFVSAVGEDSFASFLLNSLKKNNVNTEFIQKTKSNSGISVAISNNEGDYSAVVISGANLEISKEILYHNQMWLNASYLVLQNEIKEDLNILAAKEAKKRNIRVFLNAAPAKIISENFYNLIDILLVNEIEAKQITNIHNNDFEKMALNLSKKVPHAIITLGSKGVISCKKNHKPKKIPAHNVKVKSAHGAGDFFAGNFLANLTNQVGFEESILIANKKTAEFISK